MSIKKDRGYIIKILSLENGKELEIKSAIGGENNKSYKNEQKLMTQIIKFNQINYKRH